MRGVRPLLALLAALSSASVGCFNQVELAVSVVAPDGGDPFRGPDAATQVRVRVENGAGGPQTANVAANGAFSLSLDLASISAPARLIVEALAGGAVIGSGATPAVRWSALPTGIVPVFVQRRDTLVTAAPGLALGAQRTAPQIVPLNSPFVAVIGGADSEAPIDVLDLFNLGRSDNANVLRAPYTGALQAFSLDGLRVLILKGCQTTLWSATTNTFEGTGENVPPTERCEVSGSTAVIDPAGGGYLVGGTNTRTGMPSARVDRVLPSGRWVAGVPLTVPRAAPSAIYLRDGELLVAGGQADASAPALERYGISGGVAMDRRALRTGNADVDARSGATLVRAGGDMAYLLGGARVGATELATEDAVLDLGCFEQPCTLLLRTAPLLQVRRQSPLAALAEGDQVVVASGTNASGVVEAVERIDATDPRAPTAGGTVGTLGAAGLAMARVHTGSVMIAGGGQRAVWMFRH